MEYTVLIHDFAWRTLQNLDHVEEQEELGNKGVYPVTQLWNSLLGLVVAPREREWQRIPTSTPIAELLSRGWPRLTTTFGTEPETLNELFRNLRNAVAHFNVEFKPGPDQEIASVEVWNNEPRGGPTIWRGQIAVTDLNHLARQLAKLYLEEFAPTATT